MGNSFSLLGWMTERVQDSVYSLMSQALTANGITYCLHNVINSECGFSFSYRHERSFKARDIFNLWATRYRDIKVSWLTFSSLSSVWCLCVKPFSDCHTSTVQVESSSRKRTTLAWSTQIDNGRGSPIMAPSPSLSTKSGWPALNTTTALGATSSAGPVTSSLDIIPVIRTETRPVWKDGRVLNATQVRIWFCHVLTDTNQK